MDIFSDGYYRNNRILLTIIGIWPESSILSKIFGSGSLLMILWSVTLPQYKYLKQSDRNKDVVLDAIIVQALAMTAFVKWYLILSKMKQIQIDINRMREDWLILKKTCVAGVMHHYAMRGHMATLIYMIPLYSASSIYFLTPFEPIILDIFLPLNGSRPKVFAIDADYSIYGIDNNSHTLLILIHNFIIGLGVTQVIVSVDMLILIIVEHCCGLFEAVGLAKLIESTFTRMYGVIVFLNMLQITTTSFGALSKIGKYTEMTRYVLLTAGLIMHLLFMSLPGQELIDHSSKVRETIYNCNWHEFAKNEKKMIHVMLIRSMKRLYITAGKFYIMNLESFKNVMQTSFSYFTVLVSLQ